MASSNDDYISSEELFQSFMDVALIAEQEIQSSEKVENIETDDYGDKKLNNNDVNMHLPLMLRKSAEPIYESVSDSHREDDAIPQDGTLVTVTASPRKTFPVPDYPGAMLSSTDYDVVCEQNPRTNDVYAVVNKHPKNVTSSPKPFQETNENDEINCLSESNFEKESQLSVDHDNNKYETIIRVTTSAPLTDIQTKALPLSEYNIIEPLSQVNMVTSSGSDYESVNELKIQLKHDELIPPPQDGELSPEIIAFGTEAQRLHSVSQLKIYQSCLCTIDRGARNSDKKKHFFGFGKSKQPVTETRVEEKTASMSRKDSVIAIMCSGYLFKQGGTGITPKNWRLRWFELKKDNCLYYYRNEQDSTPAGAVMLTNYTVTRAVEANKRFSFKLAKGGARTYYFAANSEDEMKKWMKNLGESVSMSSQTSIPECSLKNVSVSATSISEPDCHGFLWKQGNFHKSWRRRYCVLKYGCLFYYEEMSDQCAIGVFKLQNYIISEYDMRDSSKHGIQATPPGRKMRTYYFYAESEIDWRRWLEALKFSIKSVK